MVEPTIEAMATDIVNIKEDVAEIKTDVKTLDHKLDTSFLTIRQFNAEFSPIRNLIYGVVGLILSLVITAIVYLVINKGG